ncbi:MAG: L,D-transpeptidase family protein [Gammaproteobacteria bacterium]|nr:L,D-transpeptidase family protein [Gammaproteobacteria bacterium]NND46183.1 L,D-transpeptidase family protein [Woeseiaceae bacterium]NNL45923.1 L,D-transpeptidase family protein [Woeseiaceae bacterium]
MPRLLLSVMLVCLLHFPARADEKIPAYLIRLPASVKTVFVAETSAAGFHRFDNEAGLEIDYIGSSSMSIGENGDGKQRSGDRKTPLGIYFVTEQLDTSRLHEKYGRTAFVLDYPNAIDRRLRRSGDGIWVHGVDPRGGERPIRDTDGCIALPNATLEMIEDRFFPNITPVVIGRKVRWVEPGQIDELRSELDAAISQWGSSMKRGDMHTFLSLYDADFRHWGMNKTEWIAFRARTLGTRSFENVTISDVLLLADPAEDEIYLSRFRLRTEEASNTVELTKRLYWRRTGPGALTIIAEDSG